MTLAAKFNAMTDENDHTGATRILAEAVKGPLAAAYLVILEEIADRHELNGAINGTEQGMRDAIQSDLLKTARLQGLI